MTKQEIIDLVNAKLVGQGNQVDLGSALPEIIEAILDLVGELPIASETQLGGVKIGEGISVDEDGKISAQGGGASFEPIWDITSLGAFASETEIPEELMQQYCGQNFIRAILDFAEEPEEAIFVANGAFSETETPALVYVAKMGELEFHMYYNNGKFYVGDLRQ